MQSGWIEHSGKRIFLADYARFDRDFDRLRREIDCVTETLMGESFKSARLLVDVRETVGTQEVTDLLKASASRVNPHVIKTAVVGVSGYRKILMRAVSKFSGMPLVAVDTLEEAKDWLAGED